jgi:hypothetical protein
MRFTYKYRAKTAVALVYYALISAAALLIMGYLFEPLRIGFVLNIYPEFYFHVTNLAISLIAALGIGYMWLLFGTKFRYVALLCAFLLIANIICETAMGFMNTADYRDALYGIVGVAVGFAFLLVTNRFGLVPKREL